MSAQDFPTRPIAAWWKGYLTHACPPNLDTPERWRMRRAFYAGAAGMLETLTATSSDDDDDALAPRQAARRHMQAMRYDLQQFMADMDNGLA